MTNTAIDHAAPDHAAIDHAAPDHAAPDHALKGHTATHQRSTDHEDINPTAMAPMLARVCDLSATDLLIQAGSPPVLRIGGELTPMPGSAAIDDAEADRLITALLGTQRLSALRRDLELDFSFEWAGRARFRGNAYHQRGSLALTLRRLPSAPPSAAELDLPANVMGLLTQSRGLILVTGPTGSGKSTTQAAMIDWINEVRPWHIITIEDPIEYVHLPKRSVISQREVGRDTSSFERALRSSLREDPDVLLVGEMRDLESIQSVLTLAETGHLVLATLHTNDAPTALDRIIDTFEADRHAQIRLQLSSCLVGVVAQRLVPRIGGGSVGAFEVMVATNAVRNLVRNGRTAQLRNVITTSSREGMQTLESSLSGLVASGVISREDAVRFASNADELK